MQPPPADPSQRLQNRDTRRAAVQERRTQSRTQRQSSLCTAASLLLQNTSTFSMEDLQEQVGVLRSYSSSRTIYVWACGCAVGDIEAGEENAGSWGEIHKESVKLQNRKAKGDKAKRRKSEAEAGKRATPSHCLQQPSIPRKNASLLARWLLWSLAAHTLNHRSHCLRSEHAKHLAKFLCHATRPNCLQVCSLVADEERI